VCLVWFDRFGFESESEQEGKRKERPSTEAAKHRELLKVGQNQLDGALQRLFDVCLARRHLQKLFSGLQHALVAVPKQTLLLLFAQLLVSQTQTQTKTLVQLQSSNSKQEKAKRKKKPWEEPQRS